MIMTKDKAKEMLTRVPLSKSQSSSKFPRTKQELVTNIVKSTLVIPDTPKTTVRKKHLKKYLDHL
jgi:hypothetical protein